MHNLDRYRKEGRLGDNDAMRCTKDFCQLRVGPVMQDHHPSVVTKPGEAAGQASTGCRSHEEGTDRYATIASTLCTAVENERSLTCGTFRRQEDRQCPCQCRVTRLFCPAGDEMRVAVLPLRRDLGVLVGVDEDREHA